MNKFNLQQFAVAVSGKKIVYLYRLLSKAQSETGSLLAFVTENGRTKSRDADTTATKDGSVRTPGAVETEITCSSLMAKGDKMIDKLEDALDSNELIEIWEANLEEPGTGTNKFKGMYFQGYLTEFEKTSNAEDSVELSLTFGVNGAGVRGEVTVTKQQQEMASYVFKDTVAGA
nr:phage major tail protein, TP901-1 family [uncultured Mogibacterium sp.]